MITMEDLPYTPKSWIDPQSNQIILRPNEKPLIETWKIVKITKRLAFSRIFKEGVILLLSFSVYAVLAYYINDRDIPDNNYYNNAARAFFIPWMLYIFTAYRGINKYIISLFMGMVLISIYSVLLRQNIINRDGVLFIFYAQSLIDYVSPGILLTVLDGGELTDIMNAIFAGIMGVEAVLLVLKKLFSKKQVVQVFLSEQNIYLREPSKSMFFSIVWTIGFLVLTPIIIYNYRDLIKKFKYRKENKRESKHYDYARIARGIIPDVKITSSFRWMHVVISFGLIFFGIVMGFFNVFLIFGIIWLIWAINNYLKKYRDVKIKFPFDSVVGSWFMVNPATEVSFRRLDANFAQILMHYKD
jgi:hypothetical protein